MINPIGGCSTHPISHVAVADVDAAYGACAAAENNTFIMQITVLIMLIMAIMLITMLIMLITVLIGQFCWFGL